MNNDRSGRIDARPSRRPKAWLGFSDNHCSAWSLTGGSGASGGGAKRPERFVAELLDDVGAHPRILYTGGHNGPFL
jgi:hypothetical protein